MTLRHYLAATAFALAPAAAVHADVTDTTTTAKILSDTVSAVSSCSNWRISGTCFWLRCSLWSCSIETSVQASHYNPDAVVSTFHDEDTHPWTDYGAPLEKSLRSTAKQLVGAPIDSSGTRTRDDRRDRNKLYRDADVIGHPTNMLQMAGSTFPILCPTGVRALQPYLSSYTDALSWRAMLPVEALFPEALVPGLREIGNWPLNTWSAVYPRDGNVIQQHVVKGAAVLSQRAGDITTRDGQPHVYMTLPTGGLTVNNSMLVWQPPPLMEMNSATGTWQMLAPKASPACEVFGVNDSVMPAAWGDGRSSGTGGYVFNLWRPYKCCSVEGQVFLGEAGF